MDRRVYPVDCVVDFLDLIGPPLLPTPRSRCNPLGETTSTNGNGSANRIGQIIRSPQVDRHRLWFRLRGAPAGFNSGRGSAAPRAEPARPSLGLTRSGVSPLDDGRRVGALAAGAAGEALASSTIRGPGRACSGRRLPPARSRNPRLELRQIASPSSNSARTTRSPRRIVGAPGSWLE